MGVIVGIGEMLGSGAGVGIGVIAGIGVLSGFGVTCATGTLCERAIPNVVPSASNANRRVFIPLLYPILLGRRNAGDPALSYRAS